MNTSKTAKGVRFRQAGGPDVLKVETVDVAAPAPHEVRLWVKSAGINRIDTVFRMGLFSEQPVFPSQIGFEAAGVIESVGSAVTDFKTGDKVSVVPAFSNRDYGTYGELILVPAYALQHYPDLLSFEEAASIWTSFIAAYGMLVGSARLQTGQSVLINAASSSAGLAAIQVTNLLGGISIALTTSAAKKEAILKAGAHHVIVTGEEDIPAVVKGITNRTGADVILDAVGGAQFEKLVASAAERARILAYGFLDKTPGLYPSFDVVMKMLSVTGYNMTDLMMDPAKSSAAIRFIQDGLASGKLKPVVAKSFSLEEVADAHRYLEANQQVGKVVLSINN